jgi:hypothetical protein
VVNAPPSAHLAGNLLLFTHPLAKRATTMLLNYYQQLVAVLNCWQTLVEQVKQLHG